MSTGVGCTVYLDGVRFADGSPGDDLDEPTALSGLSIQWGRDTTVDQPDVGTCTFDVMDRQGGDSFLGLLHVGKPVRVTATGTTYPDPTESTFRDPGFETDAWDSTNTNAVAATTTRRYLSGARSLRIDPVATDRTWRVLLPPGEFVPVGTQPDAWDDIPTVSPGQTWSVGASLYVPAGVVVTVRPALWTGPWRGSVNINPAGAPVQTITGNDTWQTVAAEFLPQTAGAWLGLRLDAWPVSGRRWVDVEPPEATWADQDPALQWADLGAVFVDDVAVLAPAGGTPETVVVFDGRISDLAASYDENDQIQGPVVKVTAVDFTADLENVNVGDDPWPEQPLSTRFARVLTLSGQDVAAVIDARPRAVTLCYQDVDSQQVVGLLQDFATSADGVLWAAVHATTGPYLWLEDPRTRTALATLEMGDDGLVHIVSGGGSNGNDQDRVDLSACWVLRDPVTWTQDVADVFTRAAVTWNEYVPPDPDEEGSQASTTEHTTTVVDPVLEATYGVRREQVTTLLAFERDAEDVATSILARTSSTDWRVSGVTVDDRVMSGEAEQTHTLLTLLDGTRRIGLPVRITDLPWWSPGGGSNPGYVEGGTYQFNDGLWSCDLSVSSARGQGATPMSWADSLPAWRWVDYAPDIRWTDLAGVNPPTRTAQTNAYEEAPA
jgi:hypothetical protein